jgi:membrane-associated protease RseP (regulator of RpoE activity)
MDERTPEPYLPPPPQPEYRFPQTHTWERQQYQPPQMVVYPPAVPRPKYWLHVLLFVLTALSTTLVGGWVFSASLLAILTAHEFGHYFAARHYRVPATLPYFIPFPFSLFGTLGAVIKMSPRIPHRRALFDIASAGPIAGLVLALPLTYIGITMSTIIDRSAIPEGTISLGEPLLFKTLSWLALGTLGDNMELVLNPMAFAGWAGMFVTALNLLPIGQLDGGHIAHSLFGTRSRVVAFAMFGGLAGFSLMRQEFTWVPLLLLLFFFGVQHPPSMDDGRPLGSGRRITGALLAVIFVTCFSLVPIRL